MGKNKRVGLVTGMVGLAIAFSVQAQTLPTGVTAVPFYDTSKAGLSFRKDQLSTMGMFEVPGKPEHFLVLGYWGYVWSLYPDTTKTYTPGQIKDYTRAQLANFNNMVMKGWEQGALGAAFDPNFLQNRYFYIIYNKYANASSYHTGNTPTGVDGPGATGLVVVERWILSANYRALSRDTTMLTMNHGTGYGSSNMTFGKDGYLYITTDAYSQNSWDSTNFMRKILRIDVSRQDPGKLYAIPATNPWVGVANANVKKEVYAFGFRNTYSLAADYVTGSMWGAEVGQSTWEEVNLILPGRNYGWANGGDGEASTYGIGVEGPCSNNSATGSAYNNGVKNPYTYTGPVSFNQLMNCSKFTNGTWNFSHDGLAVGGTASSFSGSMSCIILSPAFRGNPASPYYGYHFVTDVARNYFLAMKEGGGAPQNVGGLPGSLVFSGDRAHNGIISFAEDSYGNLYTVMVSSSSSGAFAWHDIMRMSHSQLTPLTTPRSQVIPTPLGDWRARRFAARPGAMMAPGLAGSEVKIPEGYSGVAVHDLRGKLVWSHRGSEKTLRIPEAAGNGVFQIRYLR